MIPLKHVKQGDIKRLSPFFVYEGQVKTMAKQYRYCIHYHFMNIYTSGETFVSKDLVWSCDAESQVNAREKFCKEHVNCNNRIYYIDACYFCG